MKLIIAGSRCFAPRAEDIASFIRLHRLNSIKEVIWGGAPGVDKGGARWAVAQKIELTEFPADWGKYGKVAGPIRNREMAQYADMLLLIWDGKSRGSANMKSEMEKLNKPIYEVVIKNYNSN